MSKSRPITIINVGYRSTNYWIVSAGTSRLLVDLGWPGTMGRMRAVLKRMDVPLNELRYGLATHYHIDHAGLGQEFKQAGVGQSHTRHLYRKNTLVMSFREAQRREIFGYKASLDPTEKISRSYRRSK